ncbi:tetratricopeptide repeat protein [Calothrix sp. UHCC 0171]|uniref:tetratricopeptide repeat protein n=1 Tax=Calothrix sp. UHCC 0171 TaxID=3110245 RepID=UPI002B1F92CF|nr:tetratricopeptide repeat protein [Calothrix sp. UHCC 0171]MEA5571396.1 tetratricopeptide repeat protein [Calothrix sp. UHCC 0171]
MSTDSIEIAKTLYQQGQIAFENGQYREAVETLEKASALLSRNTRLGGEVQIWLATAYEAAGRLDDAIDLCEQLKRHPHAETSIQAKRLQYIWKAPKLNRPKEWMTEIPDFSRISDNDNKTKLVVNTNKSSGEPKKRPEPEEIDLSQVNTKDNSFIGVGLVVVALTVLYLVWLSF